MVSSATGPPQIGRSHRAVGGAVVAVCAVAAQRKPRTLRRATAEAEEGSLPRRVALGRDRVPGCFCCILLWGKADEEVFY